MPLNKQQLEVVNQTNFPDNNTQLITPALLRDFNTDIIDSIQLTGSYATTGSNTFVGNQTITGNLNVSGVISASVLYVQTETASVIYSSGSNQLGDELTDVQTLSGSVRIQGQLLINGVPLSSGSATIDTGSLVTTASFNAYTSSNNQRVSSLETNSASVNISITNVNSATASLFTSVNSLNQFTQSQSQLNGTFATTGSNTFTGNQIIDRASKLYTNGIYWTDPTAGFNNLEIINQGGGNLDLASLNGGKVRFVSSSVNFLNSPISSSNDISTSANIYAANLTGSGILPSGLLSSSVTNFTNYSASVDSRINAITSSGGIPTGTVSSSAQITALGFVSSSVTASSLITASVNLNTITFTKGNGTTFAVTVNTGSATTTDISSLNAFTASQETKDTTLASVTSSLNSATASLFTSASLGLTTASFSGNTLTFTKGNGTTFGVVIPDISGSGVPTGTVSSSAQIVGLGFLQTSSFNSYTSSTNSRLTNIESTTASLLIETQNLELFSASALISISNLNASSASQQISINALNAATSSYVTSAITASSLVTASFSGNTLTFTKGNGTTFGVVIPDVSGSTINTGSFATTGSNAFFGTNSFSGAVSFSGSAPSILSSSFSGSLITNLTDIYTDVAAVQQIVTLTSASYAALASGSLTNPNTLYIVSGSTSGSGGGTTIPAGTVSGSAQIVELGFLQTSSFNSYTASTNSSINQLNASSASQQSSINAINSVSSSWVTESETGSFVKLIGAQPNPLEFYYDLGNGTINTVTLVAPTGSTIDTGSFATTGSNSFVGNEEITGSLIVTYPGNTGNPLIEANSSSLKLFAAGNTPLQIGNFNGNIDIFAGGGSPYNTLNVNASINQDPNATYSNQNNLQTTKIWGSLTASLQEGYVWVGDSTGKTVTVATSSFGGGSTPAGTISGSQQITDLGFVSSSVTASSLVTASFSGNTLTFTKGDASTFGVVIPDISGSTINTGSFATTGSNSFVGNQIITGSLTVSGAIEATNNIAINAGAYLATNEIYARTQNLTINGQGSVILTNFMGKPTIIQTNTEITGALNITGNLTASLQEGYVWVGNSAGKTVTVATSSFGGATLPSGLLSSSVTNFTDYSASVDSRINAITASGGIPAGTVSSSAQILSYNIFATTGSNTFIGDETLSDESGNASTLSPYSGSIVLVAKGVTSGSAGLSNITSSANLVNLIFKSNNNQSGSLTISGSNNILLPSATPTAGFRRQVTSNNIFLTTNLPEMTGSLTYSPNISGNYANNVIRLRGPVSSSAWSFSNNIVNANLNIGNADATSANQAVAGGNITTNLLLAAVNYNAYTTPLVAQAVFQANLSVGNSTLTAFSSSIAANNNIFVGNTFTVNNRYFGTSSTNAAQRLSLANNVFGGFGTPTLTAEGSNTSTSAPREAIGNTTNGGGLAIGLVLSGDNSHLYSTLIHGSNLTVTGSNAYNTQASAGSTFIGRNNSVNGTAARSGETIFAVGTGTGTGARKTGFLIDSGSNTFVEGTLNVSGSTSFNGAVNITGSLTSSLTQGYVWVGGAGNVSTLVATSSFSGVTSAITASSLITASVNLNTITFTKGDSSTFAITVDTGSGGGGSVPAGTVSSSAQILNYNIFATTGSNTFTGNQTIQLADLTTNGAIYFNGSPFDSGVPIDNRARWVVTPGGEQFSQAWTSDSSTYSNGATVLYNNNTSSFNSSIIFQATQFNTGSIITVTNNSGSTNIELSADTITLDGVVGTSTFNSTVGSNAIEILTGSINTNGAIVFDGTPSGTTPSSSANMALNGTTDFRTTYYINGTNTGSVINYINDTSNYKVAWEYEAKSNGKTGGFALQNLSGSTSLIIQAETIECSGSIKLQKGSNKQSDIVSVGSGGATVTNSLVSTNSIILLTTQNSNVAGDEYPAVVSSKSAGSFSISHGYGGTLEVGYLIINATP